MSHPAAAFNQADAAALRAAMEALAASGHTDPRTSVEHALVRAYLHRLRTTGLPAPAGSILHTILHDTSEQALVADDVCSRIPARTLDDLVKAFEVASKPTGGEGAGVVFTPAWVASFLAASAITPERKNELVVDPACGCGALLIAALRRLHHLHAGVRTPAEIIATQLYGRDLDPEACDRTRLLLALAAVELGDTTPVHTFHITAGDALDTSTWTPGRGAFGVVLGNPPYVRYQELTEVQRDTCRDTWETLGVGNYNLYYAFYELAHWLRAPGGSVAYVAPSSFLRSASAKPLRAWMVDQKFPTRVIDFGAAQVFTGAMTYVAIVLSDQAHPVAGVQYATACDEITLNALADTDFSVTPYDHLPARGWAMVTPAHTAALTRITTGRPLLDVADIRFGIATLRDNLFLVGDNLTTRDGHKVEEAATAPVVRVSGVTSQDDLDTLRTRILFPYDRRDTGAVVWTEEKLRLHPLAAAYFDSIRDELAQRDKGKKTYANWFAYGRTQGLAGWEGARLLSPLYAARPRFLMDNQPGRLFMNGISVTPKSGSGVSVELLAAILNSGICWYFIEQTSTPITGGFYSYQKGPLSALHIPDSIIENSAAILAADGPERNNLIATLYKTQPPARYLR